MRKRLLGASTLALCLACGGGGSKDVKVRGMFVHPRSIARTLASALGEVPRYEAIVRRVDRSDAIVIRVEAQFEVEALAQRFRDELKLRVDAAGHPRGRRGADPRRAQLGLTEE